MSSSPGTSVWVWDPQSVRTDLMYCGLRTSVMSKMRMPSQAFGLAALEPVLWHESSDRGASTDRNSRVPSGETVTSPCEPGQAICVVPFNCGFACRRGESAHTWRNEPC